MPAAPGLAPRLRPPSWRDPRLVLGVLLVLASVLLGSWVVGTADRTQPVWAAATTLAPGDAVGTGALTVVRARLDAGAQRYLPADRSLPPGLVALRTVGPGELVPRGAVGAASDLSRRPVGLPVAGAVPSGLVKGAQVDVWVTRAQPRAATTAAAAALPAAKGSATGTGRAPELLAPGAEVAEVVTDRRTFGAGQGATVQVLLPEDRLRAALAALAEDARVSLVLVPGSTPSAGR